MNESFLEPMPISALLILILDDELRDEITWDDVLLDETAEPTTELSAELSAELNAELSAKLRLRPMSGPMLESMPEPEITLELIELELGLSEKVMNFIINRWGFDTE